jgi:hypothetical protein
VPERKPLEQMRKMTAGPLGQKPEQEPRGVPEILQVAPQSQLEQKLQLLER